jgi:transposase
MQKEVIKINQKEATRYDVLRRVLDGVVSLDDGAEIMSVSYRHAKRLKNRAEEFGLVGLAHGNRGLSPSKAISAEVLSEILDLSESKYRIFNDTHFTEELVKLGIEVSRETLRVLRREKGIARRPKAQV